MSQDATRVLRPVAAAATAAALFGMPSEVSAQPAWVSTGVAFSVSLGKKIEVGIAMDVRMTVLITELLPTSCVSDPTAGLGPYGQFGWYSKTGWRFGAGVHGGGDLLTLPVGFDGELGWTYRQRGFLEVSRDDDHRTEVRPPTPDLDQEIPGQGPPPRDIAAPVPSRRGGHGLHLGLVTLSEPYQLVLAGFQFPISLDIPVSGNFWPQFNVGFGIRFPGTFGLPRSACVAGRPLRENGEVVLAEVLAGEACARRDLDGELAILLAAAWLDDARAECASIPVFYALARDLVKVGAPRVLIQSALAAAEEELHHTILCSELAASFAGVSLTPVIPKVPLANDGNRDAALCRLAAESFRDGCLGEGAAAAQARCALQSASDPAVRHALAIIARDEARHAELAWSVLAFCLEEGGSRVRDAVATLVRSETYESVGGPANFTEHLRGFGRISQREVRDIARRTATLARTRVRRLLITDSRSSCSDPAYNRL